MVCVVLYVVVAGRKKIKTLTHGLFCLVSIGLALRKLTQLFLLFALLRVYRVSKYSTHELFIIFFYSFSLFTYALFWLRFDAGFRQKGEAGMTFSASVGC